MAINDAQTYVPGQGRLYVAPVGTAVPSPLTAPPAPWDEIGHSSIEDGVTIGREGGDVETKGTWQVPTLRTVAETTTWFITMHLHQLSNQVARFYFGGGDASVAGKFGVPLVPVATNRAMFVRIIDGTAEAQLYVPKVSLLADDDIELDAEELMAFPVRATVLGISGLNLMEFYGAGLGGSINEVQTITVTGTPTGGTYTLTYAGQTTAAIAYNATAAAVQSALSALANIGSGNVTCAGGPHPGTAVTATFTGALAGTDVSQMTATGSFTGGSSPTVTVTTTTAGSGG